MVFLTISKRVASAFGPGLLRTGLKVRNALTYITQNKDHPYLDMMLLIPYAQKLVSLAVYDESARVVTKYNNAQRRGASSGSALDNMYDSLFGNNNSNTANNNNNYKQHDDAKTVSELRMQVLHETIRPALTPNEEWSDVMKWRWNARVIKWARTEFLVSKYGPDVKEALDAYPEIRSSPQLAKHPTQRMLMDLARGRPINLSSFNSSSSVKEELSNNNRRSMIPSSETLIKAFKMRSWAKEKHSQRIRRAMVPSAQKLGGSILEFQGALLNYAEIPSDANLETLTIEELLEVTGGHVVHCGPFNTICEEANIYQMWTQEYVEHLGNYLLDRCSSTQQQQKDKTTLVIDVGAGDGLLIQFLKEHMEQAVKQQQGGGGGGGKRQQRRQQPLLKKDFNLPTLVATDDGSWGIFAKAEVDKCSVEQAIEKYKDFADETIVLCSWMPMGQDWTAMFRRAGVDEYILIGESDDGTCGHNWETWGNEQFYFNEGSGDDDADDEASTSAPSPPYAEDGYKRWDMDVLSQFQYSRFDCAVSRSSKTVSFRKRKK